MVLACVLAILACLPASAAAATYTVNANTDVSDAIVGNGLCETVAGSGVCTLRAAIQESNASTSVTDNIHFNVGGGGAVTIAVNKLPALTNSAVVDATTQPGWSGTPIVELAGPGSGTALTITTGSATFRGFAINRFDVGIVLSSGPSQVEGNYIGTDVTGTTTTGYGNLLYGVLIEGAATNGGHTIGGTSAAARNLISGNAQGGVVIFTSDNIVRGNYIGTNPGGTAGLGTQRYGVDVRRGFRNLVGGSGAGDGNLIAGHAGDISIGGLLSQGAVTGDNRVQGNLIGTNASGTTRLSSQYGVFIRRSSGDLIGGPAAGEGNLIVAPDAIAFDGGQIPSGTTIQGNRINTNAAGTAALAGTNTSVNMGASSDLAADRWYDRDHAGQARAQARAMCWPANFGISIQGTGTVIEGNYIGVDVTGSDEAKPGRRRPRLSRHGGRHHSGCP